MPSEFELLMLKMDTGFDRVYLKMDEATKKFNEHMPVCMNRFADIEQQLAVKKAVNSKQEEQDKEKRDWGQWFVRLTMGLIATGALVLLWKLLTGGAKIVMG